MQIDGQSELPPGQLGSVRRKKTAFESIVLQEHNILNIIIHSATVLFYFLSPQKTVDCMTTMSVPSTLVKCLYLFFDLPHVPEVAGGAQNELPLAERRALLQKVFVQVRKVK